MADNTNIDHITNDMQNIIPKWSNGIQFYLSDFPDNFKTGYFQTYLQSEWSIISLTYSNQHNWEKCGIPGWYSMYNICNIHG